MGAGGGGGKAGRAERGDAEFGGGAGEGGERLGRQGHGGKGGAGGGEAGGVGGRVGTVGPEEVRKVEKEREAVGEGGGEGFIRFRAFGQRHDAVPLARVEGGGEAGGKACGAAFGHGQDQRGGRGEQAACQHALSAGKRGGKVQPAVERVIGDGGMQAVLRLAQGGGDGIGHAVA